MESPSNWLAEPAPRQGGCERAGQGAGGTETRACFFFLSSSSVKFLDNNQEMKKKNPQDTGAGAGKGGVLEVDGC